MYVYILFIKQHLNTRDLSIAALSVSQFQWWLNLLAEVTLRFKHFHIKTFI